jgi:nuclear pore complex protein Nup107
VRDSSEDSGPGWFEEFANGDFTAEFLETCQMSKEKLITLVRNLWELECLVRALDSMETLSSLAGLSREFVFRISTYHYHQLANTIGDRESSTSREMWQHTSQEVRSAKACMQPVLKNWLLVSNEGR